MTEDKVYYVSNDHLMRIIGPADKYFNIIRNFFNVSLKIRENELSISGDESDVEAALKIINEMLKMTELNEDIDEQKVLYLVDIIKDDYSDYSIMLKDTIITTFAGKPVKPKTLGQKEYINLIENNDLTFGIGPAGTGKTFLAVAEAVKAFKKKEVERIVLVRPAVEAGESLGFLPGDLRAKVDPYLRPLYDALFEIMGVESFLKNIEKQLVEISPLAYMRGRTLSNAFIILDEAQNTTNEQMKMFLTRLGSYSKAVVTGDLTQIDIKNKSSSGLKYVYSILKNVNGIGFMFFSKSDVVRHKLVKDIVNAYEKYEENQINIVNEINKINKKQLVVL